MKSKAHGTGSEAANRHVSRRKSTTQRNAQKQLGYEKGAKTKRGR